VVRCGGLYGWGADTDSDAYADTKSYAHADAYTNAQAKSESDSNTYADTDSSSQSKSNADTERSVCCSVEDWNIDYRG